jgi:DNA (cytosine-5)-methyltransferase 1
MRIGSLFSGYGGLDMAVAAHYCATVAWHCEFDKHPSAILAHHYPDIPNHHDVTSVDWAAVEPVDILTGGFPCQDVSHAGVRAGIRPGTRSGLWEHFDYAISILKPRLVVIENVSGLLSADAPCDVEPCPWCVGDEPDGHMRALGAVLADLAEAGFDAEWCSVRASDAGAPHRRERGVYRCCRRRRRNCRAAARTTHGRTGRDRAGTT